jgi:putative aldouronate transport system substrate-binding protein
MDHKKSTTSYFILQISLICFLKRKLNRRSGFMRKFAAFFTVFFLTGAFLFSGGQPQGGVKGKSPIVNGEGLPLVHEPVTVRIAAQTGPLSQTLLSDMEPVKETAKKTNINVNWTEIPVSAWVEKVNLFIASGDLPDAFIGGNISLGKNLDAFTPLDDSIARYGKAIQKVLEERPDIRPMITAPDGNIYCLPIGDESYNNLVEYHLWINKKWLDTLGLQPPRTIKEFEDVLVAFKEKDPNRNGKPDEIPFTTQSVNDLFGSFNALFTRSGIRVENGKTIFSAAEEGFYDGLVWLHSLYARSLLDQELFILNAQQYQSKYKTGDIIGSFMSFTTDTVISPGEVKNFILLLPLTGPSGKQPTWGRTVNINNQGFAITKESPYRDLLIRWYDYLNSDMEIALNWNRGMKGSAWKMRTDGKWEVATENQPKDIPYGAWRQSTAPAGNSSPVFMKAAWVGPEGQYFSTERDQIKVQAVIDYLPYLEKEYIVTNNILPSDDANRRDLLWVDLENYLKRFMAASVMNGVDRAGWNAHLNTLRSLKIDEYTALAQKYYIPPR